MRITIFPKVDPAPKDKQEASKLSYSGEVIEINTKQDMFDAITTYAWSAGVFKDNYRNTANFTETSFLPFDIDDNITLKEAIERVNLMGYSCILGTSLNHARDKDGLVADRFRLIFPLTQPITSAADYRATWLSIRDSFLEGVDEACKDPSRFFFPCSKVAYIEGHRKIAPVKHVEEVVQPKKKYDGTNKGKLSHRTIQFLEEGAVVGQRHYEMVIALLDMKAQGVTKEEAKEIIIPIMKEIKPSENVEFQINHIYDIYEVEFEYREDK